MRSRADLVRIEDEYYHHDDEYEYDDNGKNEHGRREHRRRCHVVDVTYDTDIGEWEDLLGTEDILAESMISQLPNSAISTPFDVILIDGPRGNGPDQPGRMTSISAASKLIRDDGYGVVFVDDIDRMVERVYSRYLLRPEFGEERDIGGGWGNTMRTVYYTRNEALAYYLTAAAMTGGSIDEGDVGYTSSRSSGLVDGVMR